MAYVLSNEQILQCLGERFPDACFVIVYDPASRVQSRPCVACGEHYLLSDAEICELRDPWDGIYCARCRIRHALGMGDPLA